jgi:acetylornithine deacetylase/succinyl-diaminopimelate desuccinylase-like protein
MQIRAISLLGCFAVIGVAGVATAQSGVEVVQAYREGNEAAIVRDFAEMLTYPNRARDLTDVTRAAEYIRDRMQEVGITSRLLEMDDVPPVVLGEVRVPGATRTLGLYAHYDGQPVDPANWTNPPFQPTLYTASMDRNGMRRELPRDGEPVDPEWRLYARSAGDDKAPIHAFLTVLQAFQEGRVIPTSNLVFLFDGQEEAGSRQLGDYMRKAQEVVDDVDVWLFCDGPTHQSGRPLLAFGARGAMGMEVTVYGATRNLHSGHYGNWAPDTGMILSRLLSSMKDETGRVLIDGWYDTEEPLGLEAETALRAMPDWDDQLKRELGLVRTEGEPETLPERLMVPALNVRGLNSGNTGALARNIIPNTAVAALGIRLVQGNSPEHLRQLIIDHIKGQGFHVVGEDPDMDTRLEYPLIAKVTGGRGSVAARTSMSDPFVRQVVGAATETADRTVAEGALVLSPGLGGTLPLSLFTDVWGKPAIVVPIANHDNNQHAPDENLRLANLWYGLELFAGILTMP